MIEGQQVVFTGATQAQTSWGSHDDVNAVCVVGQLYKIARVEVHTWHTKIWLDGIKGHFNSVCFEEAEKESLYHQLQFINSVLDSQDDDGKSNS